MNKEEILNKYIDLIDKGYCSDCNELNCIDNFPHEKIIHAIRELQQENQKYKEVIDKAIEYMKDFIFEPLLTNEDRKLIMYNDNLRNFEKILKEVE